MTAPPAIDCPACGHPLAGDLCRVCLVQGIISGNSRDLEELPDIEGYEVLEEVGRGGLGTVYRARQITPSREVALKLVLDQELAGDKAREAFLQEVAFAAKLEHPAVTPIYETGRADGFLYFSSRFMPGGNLAERIEKFTPQEQFTRTKNRDLQEQIALITRRLARALHHAHQHGVIHQDIKPSNILLDEQSEPYLSDFGLAVPIEKKPAHDTVSGSPAYMAPEQITGEDCSAAIDIYALGVVLFELLTGHPPFKKRSLKELFQEIRETPATFPSSPDLDPSLKVITLRCLQKKPGDRYESANDLAQDLDLWLQKKPIAARPLSAPSRLTLWAKRRPGIAALSALSILSAILLILLTLIGSQALRVERNHALTSEEAALNSEEKATRSAARYREHAYAADMYATSQAHQRGQFGFARDLLARYLPTPHDLLANDPRGFEWYAYQDINQGDDSLVFREHTATVTKAAFSPDGHFLASIGHDQKVIIRDLREQKTILTLPRKNAPGKLAEIPLISNIILKVPALNQGVLSGELTFDGVRMRSRPSNIGELLGFAWAPDGKSFATSSRGGFVRIWSFPEGKLKAALPHPWTTELAFSADGKRLACFTRESNSSRKICIHRISDFVKEREFPNLSFCFAHHKNRLACYHQPSQEIRVLNFEKDEPKHRWPADRHFSKLAFSGDGGRLFAHFNTTQSIYQIDNGELLHRHDLPGGNRSALASLNNDSIVAGSAQVVTMLRGHYPPRPEVFRGHLDEILDLDLSPDRRSLASASRDNTLRVWKINAPPEPDAEHLSQLRPILCHAPDARLWLTRDVERIYLTSLAKQIPLQASSDSTPLTFHDNEPSVATWQKTDGEITIEWWSTEDGSFLSSQEFTPPPEVSEPFKIVNSSNRRTFVLTGRHSPFIFYDLESLDPLGHLPSSGEEAPIFQLSPDGRRIALRIWPRTVRIGEPGKGWFEKIKPTQGDLTAVTFSHDGQRLITGDNENRIHIHEAESGQLFKTLTGPGDRITALAATPDGRTLAAASADKTLRLWHLPTWRELGLLHQGPLMGDLRFGDNSRTLLSTGHDHGCKVWIFPSE